MRRARQIAMIVALTGATMPGAAFADDEDTSRLRPKQPEELGAIPWGRDFDAALAQSKATRKPVMVLFDEVPGCRTCKMFGAGPLSHPLVVDAASEFVPVAVYNNVPGKDAAVLASFKEPTWNNPVVRFLTPTSRDLVPRFADDYSLGGLLQSMAGALRKSRRDVPVYLALAAEEYGAGEREIATFAMYCYWEGEAHIGRLDGVLGTRIGMLQGKEVVEVEFNPQVMPFRTLLTEAKRLKCANTVFARNPKQAGIAKRIVKNDNVVLTDAPVNTQTTQQYHLANTPNYRYLPLSYLQATKVNAAIAYRENANLYLSPRQLELGRKIASKLLEDPKAFADIKPDRSAVGMIAYTKALEDMLN